MSGYLVTISLRKEDLALIDKAANLERRTRSNFLNIAGVERAQKIVEAQG